MSSLHLHIYVCKQKLHLYLNFLRQNILRNWKALYIQGKIHLPDLEVSLGGETVGTNDFLVEFLYVNIFSGEKGLRHFPNIEK